VAKTDARVVAIDERRFLFLVQQTPNFALHLMRVLSERLRRMDEGLSRA
jgi:CRP/FNR family transcriptional regulator, cyclic AMP receptor protein